MNAISKRLLSWLCVIAMVLSFAPVMDLSNFAVETNAAAGDANWDDSELGAAGVQSKITSANKVQERVAAFEAGEVTASGFTAKCPYCNENKTWYTLDADGDKKIDFDTRASQVPQPRHLYFTGNVDLTGTTPVKSQAAGLMARGDNGGIVCVMLDNANITTDLKIEVVNGSVNVMGTGTITSDGSVADRYGDKNLGLFEVTGGTLNLYGGTFVYNNTTAALNNTGGTVNIYDGVVIGQPQKADVNATSVTNRPSANVAGTLNMFGGTIRNGAFNQGSGGNLTVSGTVNMYAGTIQDGVANHYTTGGNVLLAGSGTFNMYGGTIKDGNHLKTSGRAGNIYVPSGTTASIYGGTISGGRSNGNGGNIGVSSGTLNVYGGKIADGVATGTDSKGGNIYAWGNVTIGVDALIEGGNADLGGNIAVYRAASLTTSGTIRNGVANTNGGNIYAIADHKSSSALVAITGGMIYGGAIKNGGGSNIYYEGTVEADDTENHARTLTISGGTIVGDTTFTLEDGVTGGFTLSGAPEIVTSAEIGGETVTATTGIQLGDGELADISGLTTDADVAFTAGVGTTLTAAYDGAQSLVDAGCFSMTDSNTEISVENNQLVVAEAEDPTEVIVPAKPVAVNPGDANLASLSDDEWAQMYKGNNIDNSDAAFEKHLAKHTCPICGLGVTWDKWTAESGTLEGKGITLTSNRHYYFDSTITSINNIYISSNTDNKYSVCIWLQSSNNLTVESGKYIGFTENNTTAGGTMNFFGEGSITDENGGRFINMRNAGVLNLYGGNFVYKNVTDAYDNGAITVTASKGGTVNIYNGATIGPKTPAAGSVYMNLYRAKDTYPLTINMYGGTIQNGVSPVAGVSGNIYGFKTLTFNMYGGTIKGGTYAAGVENAAGGNLNVEKGAAINIYGGTIENGSAELGGSLYVGTGNRTSNIYGGTIRNSDAVQGGNVYIDLGALLNVSGYALISGGGSKTTEGDVVTYSTTHGGNVFVSKGDGNNGAKLAMTGGTITAGEAQYGGNVYTTASSVSSFELSGGSVTDGDASRGGNLYCEGKLTMSGASTVMSGGTAEFGGNAYLKNYPSTMSGGTIENGVSVGGGGNVYIHSSATFTMTGGTCAHGDTTDSGRTTGSANVLIDGTFNGGKVDTGTVVLKDGYDVWYPTNVDALNAYNAQTSQYVTLSGEAALSGHDVVIDVKGREVTLTGTGSITLIDTTNTDFEKFGEVTIADGASINFAEETFVGDDHYVTIQDGNKLSAHYVEMKLTHISLRTTTNGLYYKTQIKCDAKLYERISVFGVVAQLGSMPRTIEPDGVNYSIKHRAGFEQVDHTINATSLELTNILNETRDPAKNYEYLTAKVFANVYMKVDIDGDETAEYDVMSLKDDQEFSMDMLKVVQGIDELWGSINANATAKENMAKFVLRWADANKLTAEGVDDWNTASASIQQWAEENGITAS